MTGDTADTQVSDASDDAPVGPPTPDGTPSPDAPAPDSVAVDEPVALGQYEEFATTVLVPIANPQTANELLRVGAAFIGEDGGRVIPLSVVKGDDDAEKRRDELDELEQQAKDCLEDVEQVDVDPLRVTAGSVARGILDAASSTGADFLVLGAQQHTGGEVELGQVVESVIEAATCDVLLYRSAEQVDHLGEVKRVVVGVDGSNSSRAAAQTAVSLAYSLDVPCEIRHVVGVGQPHALARAAIERSLRGITDRSNSRTNIVTSARASAGLTEGIGPRDLLVLGFAVRDSNPFDRWQFGPTSKRVLENAKGPVLAVNREHPTKGFSGRLRRIVRWLQPRLTDVERELVVGASQRNAQPSLDFTVLMAVSAALSSLGLLLNSAAVIIGAMLVAPLMAPITAFGVGVASAKLETVRQALITVLLGVFGAVVASMFIGFAVGIEEATTEMLARGAPTGLDAGVAIAAGVAGAYATARKEIPAALAGVAIAAALVPPICVVGLGLALGDVGLAVGSAVLFTTNILAIAAITIAVFAWLGLRPPPEAADAHVRLSIASGAALIVMIAVIVVFDIGQPAFSRADISQAFTDAGHSDIEVTELELRGSGPITAIATARTIEPITSEEVAAVEAELQRTAGDRVALQVLEERLLVPADNAPAATNES